MNSIAAANRCRWLAVAVALACYGLAASAQPTSSLDQLDDAVVKQQYREALSALERDALSAPEKLEWLRGHAERGHVPMMYELSARLVATDLKESLKWYARGRLARTLDGAECADPRASFGWRVYLDRRVERVRDAGVDHAREFSEAIDHALAWDAARSDRPSAAWICGSLENQSGLLLPQPQRDAQRADTRETMASKANAIRDFYNAVDAGAAAKYRRLESNIDVSDGIRTFAGWLDNQRLLFAGRQPNEVARRTKDPRFPDLYLWDTGKDRIALTRTEGAIYDMCVEGDKVVFLYTKKGTDTVSWLSAGRFPALTNRIISPEELQRLFRRPDCAPVKDDPRIPRGADVYWLRSEDGFLVRINGQISLYRPNGSVVPLDVGDEWGILKGYAAFARSYLLLGGSRDGKTNAVKWSSGARDGDRILLYWLSTDGKTTSFEVPYGVWNDAAGGRYRPSRMGVLFTGGWSDDERSSGFAGLYLFDFSRTTTQLAAGPSRVIAVSPNGCRVAYAHAPNRGSPMTMSIVDVCTKR